MFGLSVLAPSPDSDATKTDANSTVKKDEKKDPTFSQRLGTTAQEAVFGLFESLKEPTQALIKSTTQLGMLLAQQQLLDATPAMQAFHRLEDTAIKTRALLNALQAAANQHITPELYDRLNQQIHDLTNTSNRFRMSTSNGLEDSIKPLFKESMTEVQDLLPKLDFALSVLAQNSSEDVADMIKYLERRLQDKINDPYLDHLGDMESSVKTAIRDLRQPIYSGQQAATRGIATLNEMLETIDQHERAYQVIRQTESSMAYDMNSAKLQVSKLEQLVHSNLGDGVKVKARALLAKLGVQVSTPAATTPNTYIPESRSITSSTATDTDQKTAELKLIKDVLKGKVTLTILKDCRNELNGFVSDNNFSIRTEARALLAEVEERIDTWSESTKNDADTKPSSNTSEHVSKEAQEQIDDIAWVRSALKRTGGLESLKECRNTLNKIITTPSNRAIKLDALELKEEVEAKIKTLESTSTSQPPRTGTTSSVPTQHTSSIPSTSTQPPRTGTTLPVVQPSSTPWSSSYPSTYAPTTPTTVTNPYSTGTYIPGGSSAFSPSMNGYSSPSYGSASSQPYYGSVSNNTAMPRAVARS